MKIKFYLSVCFVITFLNVLAQPGSLDLSFNPLPESGADNYVNTVAIQTDGKIIIGGNFTSYNGVIRNRIARLNFDGSLDYTFNSNLGANGMINNVKIQEDGKIIIVGSFTSYNGINANKIARLNADGTLDESFNSGTGANITINDCTIQSDGKIIISGNFTEFNGVPMGRIARLNPNGTLDTSFLIGTGANGFIATTCLQQDNKILIGGGFFEFNGEITKNCIRLNEDGTFDTSFNLNFTPAGQINQIKIDLNNKVLIAGSFTSANGPEVNNIARLNLNGTIDESFNAGTGCFYLPGNLSYLIDFVIQTDGKIVIIGIFNTFNGVQKSNIARLYPNGAVDESFNIGVGFNNPSVVKEIQKIQNNKLLIAGSFNQYDNFTRPFLIRLKESGLIGQVFLDVNQNCIKDPNEVGVFNKKVLINTPNEIEITNKNGYWSSSNLEAGNYTITIDTTNTNWTSTCPTTQSFTVVHPDSLTIAPSFGVISNNPCPSPIVSVNMPFMRPCFTNQQIYVQACNEIDATGVLPDAYSIVELDPNLIFENASLPYTSLGNNQFRFEHDTLYLGECVNFTISAQVSCDAILGQTLCMEANLYPVADCVLDTIPTPSTGEVLPCNLPWDQSSLSVNGWCANDSIYFTITNTGEFGGGDMECYSPVRIFVDGVLIQLDSILLQGGETFTYAFAGTAQTWILQADQHPLHPGNSRPNAHVENCGTGTWTPDLINDLPLDDADPVVDIYCGIVTGSYDPNDKRGFPNGISEEHFIAKNQDLEYIIRFQNTGTDTAFTVVVRDTLDENFNIFTVTPGVSSHSYSFRMYGPRVLEWTFANILLPDSTTNEPLSNGFLTFTVKQNPDLAEGTILSNDADIYFDFNEPIITNETEHKISYQINTLLSLEKLKTQKSAFKLYPNPSNSTFTIDLNTFSKNVNYKIYSLSGTLLQEKNSYGQKILFDVKNLENGLYIIEVEYDNRIEVLNFVRN
jgi:uncharacterized delta-60 repeat protein/uncharacterized repeat protein (TIGR01451 family)